MLNRHLPLLERHLSALLEPHPFPFADVLRAVSDSKGDASGLSLKLRSIHAEYKTASTLHLKTDVFPAVRTEVLRFFSTVAGIVDPRCGDNSHVEGLRAEHPPVTTEPRNELGVNELLVVENDILRVALEEAQRGLEAGAALLTQADAVQEVLRKQCKSLSVQLNDERREFLKQANVQMLTSIKQHPAGCASQENPLSLTVSEPLLKELQIMALQQQLDDRWELQNSKGDSKQTTKSDRFGVLTSALAEILNVTPQEFLLQPVSSSLRHFVEGPTSVVKPSSMDQTASTSQELRQQAVVYETEIQKLNARIAALMRDAAEDHRKLRKQLEQSSVEASALRERISELQSRLENSVTELGTSQRSRRRMLSLEPSMPKMPSVTPRKGAATARLRTAAKLVGKKRPGLLLGNKPESQE